MIWSGQLSSFFLSQLPCKISAHNFRLSPFIFWLALLCLNNLCLVMSLSWSFSKYLCPQTSLLRVCPVLSYCWCFCYVIDDVVKIVARLFLARCVVTKDRCPSLLSYAKKVKLDLGLLKCFLKPSSLKFSFSYFLFY